MTHTTIISVSPWIFNGWKHIDIKINWFCNELPKTVEIQWWEINTKFNNTDSKYFIFYELLLHFKLKMCIMLSQMSQTWTYLKWNEVYCSTFPSLKTINIFPKTAVVIFAFMMGIFGLKLWSSMKPIETLLEWSKTILPQAINLLLSRGVGFVKVSLIISFRNAWALR